MTSETKISLTFFAMYTYIHKFQIFSSKWFFSLCPMVINFRLRLHGVSHGGIMILWVKETCPCYRALEVKFALVTFISLPLWVFTIEGKIPVDKLMLTNGDILKVGGFDLACVKCRVVTLKRLPVVQHSADYLILDYSKYEPPRDRTNKMPCAPSEDSDQPGNPPCLIRVFAVRSVKS